MVGNKLVRSDNYTARRQRLGKEKSKLRRERRKLEDSDPTLREERLKNNVPVTIDAKRQYDPTRYVISDDVKREENDGDEVQSPQGLSVDADDGETGSSSQTQTQTRTRASQTSLDDVEVKDEQLDEDVKPQVPHVDDLCTKDGMKTLITTSPNPTKISYHFMTVLQSVFPLSETIRRGTGKYTIGDIAKYASNRGYQNLVVVNEDRKKPNAVSLIRLPAGPTAYFTISSLDIKALASHTTHFPELLLNNFSTALGMQIADVFRSLFPVMPALQGRQTVTLHNSRDFVFFRRHRYMFVGAGERVRLQEIGPRFTLKCREVVDGIARNGDLVWQSNAKLESDRTRMFL
ncbi:Ribosome production factor 1 [Savitreella phatthalungensis]